MTPHRLGRYEIRGVLGSGAMGTVYEGWDPALSRGVAIKVIQGAQLSDRDLERFRREAQTLARLVHPNIVAVHDIGTERDAPYIVMELVHGHTLAKELADGIARSIPDKVRLVAQLCDALAFANAAGVIHRDVKPGNILITNDSFAKLADFGIARLQNSSLTGTANLVGTPAYLAPEAFSGAELDGRADVYGIAATLFEWLCGARPHDTDNLAALMAKVLNADAPDIRAHWAGCPAALAECLRRGLARDRGQRHQSAQDFGQALRALDFDDGSMVDATVFLSRPVQRSAPCVDRWMRVAAAVAAIVAVAALAMQDHSPSEPPRPMTAAATPPPVTPIPAPPVDAVAADPPSDRAAISVTPARARTTSVRAATVASEVPPVASPDDEAIDEPPPVPVGTKLMVTIQTELRSDRTLRGQAFDAVLADPLVWRGREIAAASAAVRGIVDAVIPGTADRPAALQLSLVSIEIGGQPIRVRTTRYDAVAPAHGSSRALTLIIGAAGGATLGGFVGGVQGATTGAVIGASAVDRSAAGQEYMFGNSVTFKLAEPLRLQPGTY